MKKEEKSTESERCQAFYKNKARKGLGRGNPSRRPGWAGGAYSQRLSCVAAETDRASGLRTSSCLYPLCTDGWRISQDAVLAGAKQVVSIQAVDHNNADDWLLWGGGSNARRSSPVE